MMGQFLFYSALLGSLWYLILQEDKEDWCFDDIKIYIRNYFDYSICGGFIYYDEV